MIGDDATEPIVEFSGVTMDFPGIRANLTSMIPYVITVCMMVCVVVRSNRRKVRTA